MVGSLEEEAGRRRESGKVNYSVGGTVGTDGEKRERERKKRSGTE